MPPSDRPTINQRWSHLQRAIQWHEISMKLFYRARVSRSFSIISPKGIMSSHILSNFAMEPYREASHFGTFFRTHACLVQEHKVWISGRNQLFQEVCYHPTLIPMSVASCLAFISIPLFSRFDSMIRFSLNFLWFIDHWHFIVYKIGVWEKYAVAFFTTFIYFYSNNWSNL